ncbi:polysaccharide deacetylase family protein [Bacteroides muris (ex Afrizal et al. 2022)]|uniref:Polysaccharide deacetylase family protein n=1 Tax=Bacteroides muris (ex Afrizal et al. 2022) TaxID=2516960 RepID=A0A4V3RCI7_9BACE|nr:polysaccharide deacetylase family protein [Bacteroides muris (ex Afrizal et al. 2022)]TGY08910.1 polysaccharide deacetylase family protein [Bacteroides muris (ex Afrizal et al. 2022)]
MFIEQPPEFFRKLYPGAVWRMDPNEKAVYLTFDDGPIPEVTPWVLALLDKHNIKATFFMVGDNIRKHPDEFRMVVERGHRIGNHTFNHIRSFEYTAKNYLGNTEQAKIFMEMGGDINCNVEKVLYPLLFRPPHGHMFANQYLTLKRTYKIVMWDLVTRDYSKKLRGPQVLANVMRYARNGSIITFHDSLKSWHNGNLQYALPRAIDFLKEEGYEFKVL